METGYEKTIFEKIIDREIPAHIIYEDEKTLAFLDISPNTHGHTLVIPKKHAVNIFDVDTETLAAVMETVRKIAPAVRDGVEAKGLNITSNHGADAGQEVFHLHIHLIPRHERSEFEFWGKIAYEEGQAEKVAAQIRAKVASTTD